MKNYNKILIIKCGTTYSELYPQHGDFDDWLMAGTGLSEEEVTVVAVYQNEILPDAGECAAAILSGSHAMVTDKTTWMENLAEWIRGAVVKNRPLLGVCFGHQMLGYALGGKVGFNPNGLEFGTREIRLAGTTSGDRMFAGFPATFKAHLSHAQALVDLPPGSVRLASSTLDPNQAFRFGETTWGVQFHPEYTPPITTEYIRQVESHLRRRGVDVEALKAQVEPTPESNRILQRFAHIVKDRSS
ncbi:MAG: glutamine amidotransferase [Calditrichaeota bacterium]|nr:MAG: glutamine amidotransferase [Calditrichota bacterium]